MRTKFNSLLYKTNRFHVVVYLSSNRSQRTSKCGKNTFLFLPHFDVICDLLLDRCTATWNLFVKYKSLCRSVVLSFISSKKLQATKYLLLKILISCREHHWLGKPCCYIMSMSQCMVLISEYLAGHYCVIFSPLQACAL